MSEIIRASSQWFPKEGIKLEGDYSSTDLVFTLAASNISTAARIIDHNTTDHQFVRQHIDGKTGVRVFLSLNDTSGLDEKIYYWDLRKSDGTYLTGGAVNVIRGVRDPNNGQPTIKLPSVTVDAESFQVDDLFIVTQIEGKKQFVPISLLELAVKLKPVLDGLP